MQLTQNSDGSRNLSFTLQRPTVDFLVAAKQISYGVKIERWEPDNDPAGHTQYPGLQAVVVSTSFMMRESSRPAGIDWIVIVQDPTCIRDGEKLRVWPLWSYLVDGCGGALVPEVNIERMDGSVIVYVTGHSPEPLENLANKYILASTKPKSLSSLL